SERPPTGDGGEKPMLVGKRSWCIDDISENKSTMAMLQTWCPPTRWGQELAAFSRVAPILDLLRERRAMLLRAASSGITASGDQKKLSRKEGHVILVSPPLPPAHLPDFSVVPDAKGTGDAGKKNGLHQSSMKIWNATPSVSMSLWKASRQQQKEKYLWVAPVDHGNVADAVTVLLCGQRKDGSWSWQEAKWKPGLRPVLQDGEDCPLHNLMVTKKGMQNQAKNTAVANLGTGPIVSTQSGRSQLSRQSMLLKTQRCWQKIQGFIMIGVVPVDRGNFVVAVTIKEGWISPTLKNPELRTDLYVASRKTGGNNGIMSRVLAVGWANAKWKRKVTRKRWQYFGRSEVRIATGARVPVMKGSDPLDSTSRPPVELGFKAASVGPFFGPFAEKREELNQEGRRGARLQSV
ncbi:hypothetical protein BDK51DRAFT_31127, partial [Blyttiomyces helicus]